VNKKYFLLIEKWYFIFGYTISAIALISTTYATYKYYVTQTNTMLSNIVRPLIILLGCIFLLIVGRLFFYIMRKINNIQ